MRGKLLAFVFWILNLGLIPAYAGKTPYPLDSDRLEEAHPRVCGENLLDVYYNGHRGGSSPRMRGKHALPCTLDM